MSPEVANVLNIQRDIEKAVIDIEKIETDWKVKVTQLDSDVKSGMPRRIARGELETFTKTSNTQIDDIIKALRAKYPNIPEHMLVSLERKLVNA